MVDCQALEGRHGALRSCRKRCRRTGDQVFTQNFVAGPKWLAGTILKAQSPLTYEVEMSDGTN